MPNQSKRSHWVRVGAVVGLCCGVTIIACVTRLYFGYAANNAIPGTTAIVWNQPHGKDSFFSKNPNSSNDVLALLDGLEAGMGAVIAQDSGWQEGIWMAHRLGTGRYGWSVALNQDLPAIEARTRTLEAHSTYRNVDIYQLDEEVWTARYRSLWLAGNQPHLIENMVTELKDQRRSWPFRDEDRLVVATENLSAFFSGLLKGNLLKWLQRLEQKNLMLSVDSIAPMNLVGQLSPWTTQHNVPSPAAVSSYLPAQTAWCMAIAIDTLPQAAPMGSYLNSWLGNHQIVIQLALPGDELMNRVVLWPAEHARAKTGIAAISKALGTIDSYTFQMFEVLQLPGDRLFKALIPDGLTNPYIAVLGDYVALSSSKRALEQVMNGRALGLSMGQDPLFAELVNSGTEQTLSAWWYVNHKRSARLVENALAIPRAEILDFWNKRAASFATIGAEGSVTLRSRPQASGSAGEVRLLWQLPLDNSLLAGPFIYRDGLITQEAKRGLVCRDIEGSALWTYPLTDTLLGEPQPLMLNEGARRGLAFVAGDQVHVIDWQGRAYAPFPQLLSAKASAPLTVSILEPPVVFGLWACTEDERIYGFDQEGRYLPGWGPNLRLDTLSRFPVQHAQFKGKDYIVALSERDSLYIFDRMGALRLAPKPMRAKAVSPPFLQADDQQQRIAIGQADGYAQVFNLEGQTFRLSLAGQEIEEGQFLFEDIAEDGRSDYLIWNERAVQLFGYEGNTFNQVQNWTVDGVVSEVSTTKSKKESLLMAFSPSARRIWALSMDGQSLSGFPVAADRPGSTLNEDKQLWLLCYYEGSLYLYEL